MKKVFASVSLFVAITLLLVAQAFAVNIPSNISGSYRGTGTTAGWQCDVLAYQISDSAGATNRVLSVDCPNTAGGPRRSGAVSTADACPSTNITRPPLTPWGVACGPAPDYCNPPSVPRFSITAYGPSTATCSEGLGQIEVTITPFPSPSGGTVTSTFCRTAVIAPIAAYPGCSAAPVSDSRSQKR